MNKEDIAGMTGAGNFGKKFQVSEITMNGNDGHFYYRNKDAEKDAKGKYPKEDIGESVSLVFLKIRRKLSVYKPKGGMTTSEHNTKLDFVVLYGTDPQEKGSAMEMRERHPELKTVQNVYSYYPEKKEVVRFVIKGSSLGSENTAKGVKKFYDYLQSFGSDEHMHEHFTNIEPVPEEGNQGTYYAMSFMRGDKLTDEQQERVDQQIVHVHTELGKSDENLKKLAKGHVKMAVEDDDEDMPIIAASDPLEDEFPSEEPSGWQNAGEEINPEDIPF